MRGSLERPFGRFMPIERFYRVLSLSIRRYLQRDFRFHISEAKPRFPRHFLHHHFGIALLAVDILPVQSRQGGSSFGCLLPVGRTRHRGKFDSGVLPLRGVDKRPARLGHCAHHLRRDFSARFSALGGC